MKAEMWLYFARYDVYLIVNVNVLDLMCCVKGYTVELLALLDRGVHST